MKSLMKTASLGDFLFDNTGFLGTSEARVGVKSLV